MIYSKIKILYCLLLGLALLLAPLVLDFTPSGKAYAFGSNGGSDVIVAQADVQNAGSDPGKPHPTPEPGTLLLLGVGLVGVALYGRKKFKK